MLLSTEGRFMDWEPFSLVFGYGYTEVKNELKVGGAGCTPTQGIVDEMQKRGQWRGE